MNAKEAREIVKRGVIPGDIDSIDLAKAEGYLAALEGPEVGRLVDALGKISTTNGLQYSDIFRICDEGLAEFRKII